MLKELIEQRGWLLADGATGTNYFLMGLQAGAPPELWNIDHSDRVEDLHRRFVEAGSDIILTNTFGGNGRRMMLHNDQHRVHEINKRAAEIARKVADSAGRPVVVSGSMGPTGELFEPLGQMTWDDAVGAFREQAEGLRDGGADVIWIETMSALEEVQAAAAGAKAAGMDYVFTLSFDTKGRTMMGLAPDSLGAHVAKLEPLPLAFGANCGVGASDMLATLLEITRGAPGGVVIAKANCGIPEVVGDKIVYSGTPELMIEYARAARDGGARIIGGCCGTTPDHVAAMRQALNSYEPGPRPNIDDIIARVAPLRMKHQHLNAPAKRERKGRRVADA